MADRSVFIGRDEMTGDDLGFPLPAVGDEQAVLRGGVIEAGDVVALGANSDLPGLSSE